jgi:hypothetical protein
MLAIEIGREAATLVMLLAVAVLAGAERWDRFLLFCVTFGVWDLRFSASRLAGGPQDSPRRCRW